MLLSDCIEEQKTLKGRNIIKLVLGAGSSRDQVIELTKRESQEILEPDINIEVSKTIVNVS